MNGEEVKTKRDVTTLNYDKHVTGLIVTTVQFVATVLFALVYCWGSFDVLVGATFLNFIIFGKFTNFRCAWATSRVITRLLNYPIARPTRLG